MEAGEGIPLGDPVTSFPQHQVKAPDYMDWVLGWKHVAVGDDGEVTSLVGSTVWQPGENLARHYGGITGCPHKGDHCGWNVFYGKEDCQMAYGRPNVVVRGRGERFAIHPDGFRAEWAEIVCLIGRGDRYKKAGERYGVPVFRWWWQAEAYVYRHKELGSYFPRERRPKKETFFRKERVVDWNEVPIGDMTNPLANRYTLFLILMWTCVLIGFVYGGIVTLGGGI